MAFKGLHRIKTMLRIICLSAGVGIMNLIFLQKRINNEKIIYLVIIGLSLTALSGFGGNKQAEIIRAAKVLEKYGEELAQKNELAPQDKAILNALSKINIPAPKMVKGMSTMSMGVDFETSQPIVLNSFSGESVESCNSEFNTNDDCGLELIDPPALVELALASTSPLKGKEWLTTTARKSMHAFLST